MGYEVNEKRVVDIFLELARQNTPPRKRWRYEVLGHFMNESGYSPKSTKRTVAVDELGVLPEADTKDAN